MSSRNQQHGLTLIDILVVLAILAILVMLLLPALLTREPPSRSINCLINLKQINLGLLMYREDHTNQFPNLDQQPGNDGPAAFSLLSLYNKETHIFICPWVANQREKSRGLFQKKFEPTNDRAFYISNGNDYAYYDGISSNSMINPSTTPITADRLAWTNRSSIDKKILNHPDGAINIGFADGHVERARPNIIIIGTNLTPPWSKALDPTRAP